MELSGVYKIELYNADDLELSFIDSATIALPANPFLTIENEKRPNLRFTIEKRQRQMQRYAYNIDFILFNLSQSVLASLKSIHGFIPLVKYYNGNEFIYNTPFFINESKFNTNQQGIYSINMKTEGYSEFKQLKISELPWILADNVWDDNGIWIDEETWND